MSTRKTFYFAAVGRGVFPFDMLRYDQAFPATEGEDSPKLAVGLYGVDEAFKKPRVVVLCVNWEKHYRNTPGRWESFGWRVSLPTDAAYKAREDGDMIVQQRYGKRL